MTRRLFKTERRAIRVERALTYINMRRERDLLNAVGQTFESYATEGFLEQVLQWQVLPESMLIALWRFRGRWPSRLERNEVLESIRLSVALVEKGEVGKLAGDNPERQADLLAALVTAFIYDELSFDGPEYTSFCGRLVYTPLSTSGAFADLRLGQRLEI